MPPPQMMPNPANAQAAATSVWLGYTLSNRNRALAAVMAAAETRLSALCALTENPRRAMMASMMRMSMARSRLAAMVMMPESVEV